MASNVLSSSTPATIPCSSIQTSFLPKTSQFSIFKKKKPYHSFPNKGVSCKATNRNQNNGDFSSFNKFDRRDVLVGLGGLYGATNLANDPFALASPVQAPDLEKCGDSTIKEGVTIPCCPPATETILDFKPPRFSKIRTRPAAHLVDADYITKFNKALQLMRDLPDEDPRSFKQQADVHCAYCNEGYKQFGFSDKPLQVHSSWLFLPFHRFYLYFFERILGKLIDDPDFAIPFWNWDTPKGMPIPAIYTDTNSSLYDEKRNQKHEPPTLADLDYNGTDEESTKKDQILSNFSVMYKELVYAKGPRLFHGEPYVAGQDPNPGQGSLERGSHTALHRWCGDPNQKYNEDMGNFYSAGRDPLFYAHHANVDRMWCIWKDLPGKYRRDFKTPDWLYANFIFYDENKKPVRVRVRDCLDTKMLGYEYQSVNIPWLKSKPTSRKSAKKGGKGKAIAAESKAKVVTSKDFPIVVDKILRVEVPRPKKSRSKAEKEDVDEVLVLQKIELDAEKGVKIDVYINDEDDETPTAPEDTEFAGSFTNVPRSKTGGKKLVTNLRLPITDILEDLDVEGDDNILVTLVPKEGKGLVTIGAIKIDFIQAEE